MATPSTPCDICQSRGSNRIAVIWCFECDERLCTECSEHHSISKATKSHSTQSAEDYIKLPDFILSPKDYCDEHNCKYELFCTTHDKLCCVQCIPEKHKDCDQLSPLSSVVKNIKNSSLMNHIEKTIEQLVNTSELLIDKCKYSIGSLKSTMERCKMEIRELRQTIETHIRKVEKQILDDLSFKYNKSLKIKEAIHQNLEEASERLKNTASDLVNIKKHGSETQIFLGLREIERFTQKDKCFLDSLPTEGILKDSECKFEISPAIFYMTSDFTLLGTVSVDETPMNLSLISIQGKEAQIVKSSTSIHQYKIINTLTLRIPAGKNPLRITGCAMLSSGHLAFSDRSNDRLVVLDSIGKLLREIAIAGSPIDVCCLSKNQAVVSLAKKPKLKIINMGNGSTVRKYLLPSPGYGVYASESITVVRIKDIGFQIKNIAADSNKLIHVPGDCILYVSYWNERLYYTKWDVDKVICCDLDGKIIWEFANDVLKKPCGISMTDDGNIFVAGFESNNILIISADGKTFREFVRESNSLNSPSAIHIRTDLKQLVVVNLNDGICTIFTLDC